MDYARCNFPFSRSFEEMNQTNKDYKHDLCETNQFQRQWNDNLKKMLDNFNRIEENHIKLMKLHFDNKKGELAFCVPNSIDIPAYLSKKDASEDYFDSASITFDGCTYLPVKEESEELSLFTYEEIPARMNHLKQLDDFSENDLLPRDKWVEKFANKIFSSDLNRTRNKMMLQGRRNDRRSLKTCPNAH